MIFNTETDIGYWNGGLKHPPFFIFGKEISFLYNMYAAVTRKNYLYLA
jgi:hypothetical protein